MRKVLGLFTFLIAACLIGCGDSKGVVPPSDTKVPEKSLERKPGNSQKREGGPQPIK